MQFVASQLGAAQDEADLRAVAVGYGHIPAVLDHPGNMARCLVGRLILILDALVLFVLD